MSHDRRDPDPDRPVPGRRRGGGAAGQAAAHRQRAGLSAGRRADRAVRPRLRLLRLRGELGPALRRVRRGAAAVPDRPRAAPQAAVDDARRPSSASAAPRWRSPALALAAIGIDFGLAWPAALFAGLALSLSSTAFALQVLEEKGELALRHGRLAFAVLLFQDLVAIPLIALPPLFAVSARGRRAADGRFVRPAGDRHHHGRGGGRPLRARPRSIRLIARTRVKEAMTASALLTVVGVTLVMEQAGLSAALGAFIAGVLLADSDYRHEIERRHRALRGPAARPVLHRHRHVAQSGPDRREAAAGAGASSPACSPSRSPCCTCSAAAPAWRPGPSRRFALAIAQGGEFAFVLFTAGVSASVLEPPVAELLSVAVTLSMAATPLLLLLDEMLAPKAVEVRAFDALPEDDGHVVIAGFGRVGQIVARILQRQAHPLHGARRQRRAGRFRAQVRRRDLLRRRQPARDPGGGPDRQGARLRAGHRQRRGLAPHGAAGAPELSARADLRALTPSPAHAPADGCSACR